VLFYHLAYVKAHFPQPKNSLTSPKTGLTCIALTSWPNGISHFSHITTLLLKGCDNAKQTLQKQSECTFLASVTRYTKQHCFV
jgi:hypothetical protein